MPTLARIIPVPGSACRPLGCALLDSMDEAWISNGSKTWSPSAGQAVWPERLEVRTGGLAETLVWLEQGQTDLLVAYHHPAIAQRP